MAQFSPRGFTLVELAIALMVIGLLIGGVLKGQELIENARITKVARDFNSYKTAMMIFKSTYNAFPGDMRLPYMRLPNCEADTTYCSLSGNNDGLVGTGNIINQAVEPFNVFVHMHKAGLLQGTTSGKAAQVAYNEDDMHLSLPQIVPGNDTTYLLVRYIDDSMRSVYESSYGITFPKGPNIFQMLFLPAANPTYMFAKMCQQLDAKMDDGKSSTGDFVAVLAELPSTLYTSYDDVVNIPNVVCIPYADVGM